MSRRPDHVLSPEDYDDDDNDDDDDYGQDDAENGHGAIRSARPRNHDRGYSISSAFDFTANLFPLSSSTAMAGYAPVGAPAPGDHSSHLHHNHHHGRLGGGLGGAPGGSGGAGSLEKRKSLTYLNGVSLLVGLIVGSGIFASPSRVNANVGSPGASLIVWAVAGVLAWTGAASYAELGSAMPLNGGAQVYLAKIFGEWAGFLFTWCAVLVLRPVGAAITSLIFGEYVVRAVLVAGGLRGSGSGGNGVGGGDESSTAAAAAAAAAASSVWLDKGVALAALLCVLVCNCVSTRLATRVTDVFMFVKFVALLGVVVTGVVVAVTGFSWQGTANREWKTRGWFENTSTGASSWAVALYAGLWAYDGWDNVRSYYEFSPHLASLCFRLIFLRLEIKKEEEKEKEGSKRLREGKWLKKEEDTSSPG